MDKLHLVTGYRGEEHIHSADQGSFNAAFFGSGEYVTESGNQFEASIMDNNTVRILDGDALMKGRHLRIEPNTYADVTITTGTAGMNRNDLIVFQYNKDTSTDIETPEIVVIRGTETEGTATDPAYTDGDILAGATFNQMPMYRVKVEGVVLTAVEPLFSVIPTYKKLAEQYAKQFQDACNTYLGALNILDTKEEIEANTKENQLAGALALKEVIAAMKAGITTQYDEDADELQFKTLSDGKWHCFASGGLKSFDLNDLTKLSSEDWEFEYANGATTAEITSNPFKLAMTAGSGSSSWKVVATTVKSLSLGAFNRFVMNGKLKGYKNNPTSGNCHRFALVNETTGNEDYTWEYLDGNASSAVAISESTIISLDPTATYKIQITLYGYAGHMPSYFQFDDFRLYKE